MAEMLSQLDSIIISISMLAIGDGRGLLVGVDPSYINLRHTVQRVLFSRSKSLAASE